jgi:hypothetical protein
MNFKNQLADALRKKKKAAKTSRPSRGTKRLINKFIEGNQDM